MCLAKAFFQEEEEPRLILSEISSLRTEGGKIFLQTLFGEEKIIEGEIKEIDFVSSRLVISPKTSSRA